MNLRRRTAALLLTSALAFSLAACGGDDGLQVATDPGPTDTSTSASIPPTPTGPTVAPKPGSLPDFPYADYAYTLEQRCFCANIDQKYRVTVVGGKATEVTWATAGDSHQVGDPVPDDAKYLMLSIQDIVDQGNDPKAARIEVEWPAGQLYPTSVYIDRDKMIADEEVTWVISDVVPA
jgi:hypothetical protein